MLQINNIEVVYSDVILVLRGISLAVPDNQIVSLLGANGAGKSTTLKAISGLLRTQQGEVTRGSIEWNGERIDRKSPDEIVQMGIVQLLEGRRLFEHLTVEENLRTGAIFRKTSDAGLRQDLDEVYGYFPRLAEFRGGTAGYLSGGEQQMVAIGRGADGEAQVDAAGRAEPGAGPAAGAIDLRGDPAHKRRVGRVDAAGGAERECCVAVGGACLCDGDKPDCA